MKRASLILIIAVTLILLTACNETNPPREDEINSKIIVESTLQPEEMIRLEISINNEVFIEPYEIKIPPGHYQYEARLDGRVVSGSIVVADNKNTILYLHFPEKQSGMVGSGRQVYFSPSGRYLAYLSGESICIYDTVTHETKNVKLNGEQYVFLKGWQSENTLIADFKDTGTFKIVNENGTWKLQKISDSSLVWSNDFRFAAVMFTAGNKTEILTASGSISQVVEATDFDATNCRLAAISPDGSKLLYLKEESLAGQAAFAGSALILYDIRGKQTVTVEEDAVLFPDLISFSPGGRYLCYIRNTKDSFDELIIFDTETGTVIFSQKDTGLWWDWDCDEKRILLAKRSGQAIVYNLADNSSTVVYEGEAIAEVSWLNENNVGVIDNAQFYILDLADRSTSLVDNEASDMIPSPSGREVAYIADYNFIMITDY